MNVWFLCFMFFNDYFGLVLYVLALVGVEGGESREEEEPPME